MQNANRPALSIGENVLERALFAAIRRCDIQQRSQREPGRWRYGGRHGGNSHAAPIAGSRPERALLIISALAHLSVENSAIIDLLSANPPRAFTTLIANREQTSIVFVRAIFGCAFATTLFA